MSRHPFWEKCFQKLKLPWKKYLTLEKYLDDLRRCKIKFQTTFLFYTMLIFPLLFELESLNILKNVWTKIFSLFLKYSVSQKGVKKSTWSRKQKLSEIWNVFLGSNIFLRVISIFESIFLKRDVVSDLVDNEVCLALARSGNNLPPTSSLEKFSVIFCV